jgi:hypothetical protein
MDHAIYDSMTLTFSTTLHFEHVQYNDRGDNAIVQMMASVKQGLCNWIAKVD